MEKRCLRGGGGLHPDALGSSSHQLWSWGDSHLEPAWNLLGGLVEKGEAMIDECLGVAALGQRTASGKVQAWKSLDHPE